MNEHSKPHTPDFSDDNKRRGFMVKIAAIVVGGITSIIPAVFAGGFFLTPLLKKRDDAEEKSDGFVRVGSTASLVPGGAPLAFKIRGIKIDAWTTYAEAAIGSVYVLMDEAGALTAFNATCTHLGCTVNYKSEENSFACPCHDSAFALDGERTNDIPPRNMDTLEVEIRNKEEVWVKYQSFRAGTSGKIPV